MKNQHRFAGVILAAAVCNFVGSIAASATVFEINMVQYPQEEDLWCYAACAECSAKHSYPNSTRTQESAVIYVKGFRDIFNGGTFSETKEAAEYLSHDTLTYRTTTDYMVREFYIGQIVYDHATIVGRLPLEGGEDALGHMVVVTAVVTGQYGYTVYYYDPLQSRNRTYAANLDNFHSGAYDGYETAGVVYIN